MDKYINKPFEMEIVFSAPSLKEYGNLSAACQWLEKNGYSYGDYQDNSPIAIQRGVYTLPKLWGDIAEKDKQHIAGVLIPWGGIKYGNVRMRLFRPDFSNLQIGDVFPYGGRLYKVKADTEENIRICSNCAFDKRRCEHFNCLSKDRPDAMPVVFVECNGLSEEIHRAPAISQAKQDVINAIKKIAGVVDHSPAHIAVILEEYTRACCKASLKAAADNWEVHRIDDERNIVLL